MSTRRKPIWIGLSLMLLGMAVALPAVAGDSVDVDINGYYRLRGYLFQDLDLNADAGTQATAYTEQRLRLEPAFRISENLAILTSMDVWDNVMGGHQAASPAPLFAGTGSYHQKDMTVVDTIEVKRIWVEYLSKVGLIRFGRMPSHFGVGIFSNDGGNGLGLTEKTLEEKWNSYFDEDFGDNDSGSTYDRILFATRPMGKDSALLVGLYWDHLVEGNINKGSDDVDEYGGVVYYKPEAEKDTGNITQGGAYYIYRKSYGTKSVINSISFHFKTKHKPFFAEAELVALWGESKLSGIPFTTHIKADIGDVMPWIVRLGYDNDSLSALLEVGSSPGDKNLGNPDNGGAIYPACNGGNASSCNMTTFNIHSGYRVGLLMFTQVLSQDSGVLGDGDGVVINATYVNALLKYRLSGKTLDGVSLLAGLLWAKSNEAKQFRGELDNETDLGYELDLGMQYYFNQNLRFDLQGGYLLPGKGYSIVGVDANGDAMDPDPAWALISKFTVVF